MQQHQFGADHRASAPAATPSSLGGRAISWQRKQLQDAIHRAWRRMDAARTDLEYEGARESLDRLAIAMAALDHREARS